MTEITIKFEMPKDAEDVIVNKTSEFLGLVNIWCKDIQYTAFKIPPEVDTRG